jgi:hypothetical protein
MFHFKTITQIIRFSIWRLFEIKSKWPIVCSQHALYSMATTYVTQEAVCTWLYPHLTWYELALGDTFYFTNWKYNHMRVAYVRSLHATNCQYYHSSWTDNLYKVHVFVILLGTNWYCALIPKNSLSPVFPAMAIPQHPVWNSIRRQQVSVSMVDTGGWVEL